MPPPLQIDPPPLGLHGRSLRRSLPVVWARPDWAGGTARGVQSAWRGTKKSKTDNCRPAAVSSRGCALRGLIHPSIPSHHHTEDHRCVLSRTRPARPGQDPLVGTDAGGQDRQEIKSASREPRHWTAAVACRVPRRPPRHPLLTAPRSAVTLNPLLNRAPPSQPLPPSGILPFPHLYARSSALTT